MSMSEELMRIGGEMNKMETKRQYGESMKQRVACLKRPTNQ